MNSSYIQLTIVLGPSLRTKSYGYTTSEKKKSLFIGGGPGNNPLGISTISPDKSAHDHEQVIYMELLSGKSITK